MRKVFLAVFILISFAGMGQIYQAMPQAGYGPVKRFLIDSVLTIPMGKITLRNITGGRDTAQIRYNIADSSMYVYSGYQWIKLGSGSSGWGLTGNAGTNPATNFLGTTDSVRLDLRTNNTIRQSITGSGNVGIGTVTPSVTLDVYGSARVKGDGLGETFVVDSVDNINLQARSGTDPNYTDFNIDQANGFYFRKSGIDVLGNLANGASFMKSYDGFGSILVYPDSFHVLTNNTRRLTINSLGNVGIGTSSPTAKLHVFGSALIKDSLTVSEQIYAPNLASGIPTGAKRLLIDGSGKFYSADTTAGGGGGTLQTVTDAGNTTTNNIQIEETGSMVFVQPNTGTVSINAPTALGVAADNVQTLQNASGTIALLSDITSTDSLLWSQNGTNIFNKSGRNVGINTSTPSTALHIIGAIKATDSVSFTGLLPMSAGTDSVVVIDTNGKLGTTAKSAFGSTYSAGYGLSLASTTFSADSSVLMTKGTTQVVSGAKTFTSTITANATIDLPTSSSASVGVIKQNGNRFIHNYGTNNLFIGDNAGNFTLSGSINLALGKEALSASTSGIENTAIGYQALKAITTGSYNSAYGKQALLVQSDKSESSAFGRLSLANANADYNTGVGNTTLYGTTSGGGNTGIGYNGGRANTTGTNNTYIGYNAGYTDGSVSTTNNLTNASAFGYNAQVTASNSLILGGTGSYAVKVGIGTTAPDSALTVNTSGHFKTNLRVDSAVNIQSTQTTVNAASSGTIVCSMPFRGSSYKKVIVYCNVTLGAATYTFPVAFTNTPKDVTNNGTVSALTTTSVTITGISNTGFIIIEGY